MKSKIILIDWGIFSHRAIFSYASALNRAKENPKTFIIPATYTCLSMIFSSLKKIGVNADVDDKIIIAVDSKNNWRKKIDPNYKLTRKEQREKTEVNWKKEFNKMNELLKQLDVATPFFILKINSLEADDIIACACRYYKDREVVIVSYDCLGSNTLVKMSKGNSQLISTIKPKDKVLTYNFKFKKFEEGEVKKVHRVKHNIEYQIYFGKYKLPIQSSSNHNFLTNKGWKKAKELKKGDILLNYKEKTLPKNNLQNNYKIGYILGFALGDGHINYKKKLIQFELKDLEPLKRIKNYVKDLFDLKVKIKKVSKKSGFNNIKQKYYISHIYFNIGFDYLLKYLKEDFSSLNYKKGFLAGFFDAEGSIREVNKGLSIGFYNYNKKLLSKISNYLKNLNIKTQKVFISSGKCFKLQLDSDNSVRFFNSCKPSLLRKYPKWKYHYKYLQNGLEIKQIKKKIFKGIGKKYHHYDLTVIPNHNYIINDKIIVHNSDFHQLLTMDNVKIFSPHPKAKNCPYKILDLDRQKEKVKAFKSLSKKIDKEASDNLKSELLTEKDFENREMIVSLLKLPSFVSLAVRTELDKIDNIEKDFEVSLMPFSKTMIKRFYEIFQENKVITYDSCKKKLEKKYKTKKKRR